MTGVFFLEDALFRLLYLRYFALQVSLKGRQEEGQGYQSPREESLPGEGKVPQVQEPQQGIL